MSQNVYIKNKQLIKNECFLNAEHILSLFLRQHSFHTHIVDVSSTLTANVMCINVCVIVRKQRSKQYKQYVLLYKVVIKLRMHTGTYSYLYTV